MDVDSASHGRAGLFVGLLGPLAAWRNGEPLELGTPQQKRLLAALVLRRNEPVSLDRLVEVLWPARPPAHAVQTVRTYLSRLRASLETGGRDRAVFTTHPGGYGLRLAAEELDLDLFESLAADGRAALDAGDAAAAEAKLRAALALVRGPPLAGMEYEEAFAHEVERLLELDLLAREELVEARLALGEHRELVPELRASVAAEPLRERLWAQLMLALYRSGREAEALDCYRQAHALLAERLGLEPGRELRELERMILLQQRTLDHREVGRTHGVPSFSTSFLGREDELAAIPRALREQRLLTLVGAPGAGKTRLAVEAAARLRRQFADGIWWVDLAAVAAGDVPRAFARGLALRETAPGETAELVVARLRGARTLLLVDNCEHVAAAAAELLGRVLAETAGAHVLATSREPLHLGAEAVIEVRPLPVAPIDAEVAAIERLACDAARLFLARGALVPDRLDDDEAAAIGRIVSALDGLPLAIELAAGRLRTLTLGRLADNLEQRLGLLRGGDHAAPPRHRTLQAAIGWSYDLLDDDERSLLRSLAVFPGSFDTAAAEAVAAAQPNDDSVLDTLAWLTDRSLLSLEPGEPPRYRLLQTVRAFLLDQARATPELEAAARRHRDHFTARGEHVFRQMLEPGLGIWLDRTYADQHNYRAALLSSLDHEHEQALQLASALTPYWFRTSQLSEERHLLELALEQATPDSRWRPRGLTGLAFLKLSAGAADARAASLDAVEACQTADPELLAISLAGLAQAQMLDGDLDDAERSIRRARALFRGLAHPEGLHFTDELMGVARYLRGYLESALRYLLRSRDGYFEMRGTAQAGWTHIHLARVQLALGRLDDAERSARTGIEEFQARHDARGLAAAYTCLGHARVAEDDSERARVYLDEALRLARRWNYPLETAQAQEALRALADHHDPEL